MKRPKKKSLWDGLNKKMIISADTKYLAELRKIIYELWQKSTAPMEEAELISLAIEEALNSIIYHAQALKQSGNIILELCLNDVCFKVIIRDQTRSLDFNLLSQQEKKNYLKKEKRHQIRLPLISTIMDEVTYQYKKGFQNEWQLIKFLPVK